MAEQGGPLTPSEGATKASPGRDLTVVIIGGVGSCCSSGVSKTRMLVSKHAFVTLGQFVISVAFLPFSILNLGVYHCSR